MSLSSESSDAAENLTVSRHSRCSAVSGESSASSVMPMMPFIGVRISWLMLARNSLFARLPSIALSRASAARCWPSAGRRSGLDDALERVLLIEQAAVAALDLESISLKWSISTPTSSCPLFSARMS
jgi:hypothetical protein